MRDDIIFLARGGQPSAKALDKTEQRERKVRKKFVTFKETGHTL